MRLPRTILALVLMANLESIVAMGQDRERGVTPSDEIRDAIERLEAKIKRLERELQQTREDLRNLKQRETPPPSLSRPIPYLRFPIEVERAMMGDAWRFGRPIDRERPHVESFNGGFRQEVPPRRNRLP